MATLGWCQSGKHMECPGSIMSFYWVDKKVKRETVQVKVENGQVLCDCKHHGHTKSMRAVEDIETGDLL